MNAQHLPLIHQLLTDTEQINLPIWLGGGWAVDARLGHITREHEEIDLAVPAERMDEFIVLLQTYGAGAIEQTDYGFLVTVAGVLLDCEPCERGPDAYEIDGVPAGACPLAKEGVIDGVDVLCISWHAILWDYFYYLQEVPYADWPAKDKASYAVVRQAIGEAQVEAWHDLFRRSQ